MKLRAARYPKRPPIKRPPEPPKHFSKAAVAGSVGIGAAAVSLSGLHQADKFKHMKLTGAASFGLSQLGFDSKFSAGIVFLSSTVAKELVYDLWLGKGNASWLDVAANLAGSLAGVALSESLRGSYNLLASSVPPES